LPVGANRQFDRSRRDPSVRATRENCQAIAALCLGQLIHPANPFQKHRAIHHHTQGFPPF
jgi:hypothetical protein